MMNARIDPWYRHPIMWLVVAPPVGAVIAGIITLGLILQRPEPEVRTQRPAAAVIHGNGSSSVVPPAD
jgi:membrane protein required for beta-lactamase induction